MSSVNVIGLTYILERLQQRQLFNGPLSGTTRVSRYQKGRTNLDLLDQEIMSGSGFSWDICKFTPHFRQITMPASHHSVFTGRMPFRPPNQQRQSTEGYMLCIVSMDTNFWSCHIGLALYMRCELRVGYKIWLQFCLYVKELHTQVNWLTLTLALPLLALKGFLKPIISRVPFLSSSTPSFPV